MNNIIGWNDQSISNLKKSFIFNDSHSLINLLDFYKNG